MRISSALAIGCTLAWTGAAAAQAPVSAPPFPSKAMRMIVAYAPGGTVDIIARIITAPDMKERLRSQGADPLTTSPNETRIGLVNERDRLIQLFRETNYKAGQ